jgi:NTP pyrophosphatase (non-canonical NTP hydrolase)
MSYIAYAAAKLSDWIDEGKAQAPSDMSDGEWTLHRVMKVAEESGEVFNAIHNARGGNPRKGVIGNKDNVIDELLDTASAALCAVEHLTGNCNQSTTLLEARMKFTLDRVGL